MKQGGVLSAKLFNLFINDLIEEIERMGYRETILDKKIPIVGFCDDTLVIEKLLENMKQ